MISLINKCMLSVNNSHSNSLHNFVPTRYVLTLTDNKGAQPLAAVLIPQHISKSSSGYRDGWAAPQQLVPVD